MDAFDVAGIRTDAPMLKPSSPSKSSPAGER